MRMLIALDGSRFAEAVLTPAAELAARSAAEVHLVEVVKEIYEYSSCSQLKGRDGLTGGPLVILSAGHLAQKWDRMEGRPIHAAHIGTLSGKSENLFNQSLPLPRGG